MLHLWHCSLSLAYGQRKQVIFSSLAVINLQLPGLFASVYKPDFAGFSSCFTLFFCILKDLLCCRFELTMYFFHVSTMDMSYSTFLFL